MSFLERLKSVVSRIRWKSVFALLLLAATAYVVVEALPGGYAVGGDVGIRVSADPPEVSPGGSAMLDVELKNLRESRDMAIIVSGQTYDPNVYFDDTYAQTYGSRSINIGPQETRKLTLKVRVKPEALQGSYVIDFKATPQDSGGAETRLAIDVERS